MVPTSKYWTRHVRLRQDSAGIGSFARYYVNADHHSDPSLASASTLERDNALKQMMAAILEEMKLQKANETLDDDHIVSPVGRSSFDCRGHR